METLDWRPLVKELDRIKKELDVMFSQKRQIEEQLKYMSEVCNKVEATRKSLREYLLARWRQEGHPEEMMTRLKAVEKGDDIPF